MLGVHWGVWLGPKASISLALETLVGFPNSINTVQNIFAQSQLHTRLYYSHAWAAFYTATTLKRRYITCIGCRPPVYWSCAFTWFPPFPRHVAAPIKRFSGMENRGQSRLPPGLALPQTLPTPLNSQTEFPAPSHNFVKLAKNESVPWHFKSINFCQDQSNLDSLELLVYSPATLPGSGSQ